MNRSIAWVGIYSDWRCRVETRPTCGRQALISYDGLQRVQTKPVPLPALREAALKAVVPKDYTSGAPIQISVRPNQLMSCNSGRLSPECNVPIIGAA